jgi:hypothetical protein
MCLPALESQPIFVRCLSRHLCLSCANLQDYTQHEGSKGYSCCKRRVLEFDEFRE